MNCSILSFNVVASLVWGSSKIWYPSISVEPITKTLSAPGSKVVLLASDIFMDLFKSVCKAADEKRALSPDDPSCVFFLFLFSFCSLYQDAATPSKQLLGHWMPHFPNLSFPQDPPLLEPPFAQRDPREPREPREPFEPGRSFHRFGSVKKHNQMCKTRISLPFKHGAVGVAESARQRWVHLSKKYGHCTSGSGCLRFEFWGDNVEYIISNVGQFPLIFFSDVALINTKILVQFYGIAVEPAFVEIFMNHAVNHGIQGLPIIRREV